MTTPPTTRRHARALAALHDTTTITTLIDPAVTNINTATRGYPTRTPGANPNTTTPTTDGPDNGITHDQARHDLQTLDNLLKQINTATRLAAIIVTRWATNGLNDHTIAKRLATADANIWCDNCARHGHKTPRRENARTCEFCAGFQSDWKQPAPKEVLDLRTIKGRIYDADIRRILNRKKTA